MVVNTPPCKLCCVRITSYNVIISDIMMVADITPDIVQWLLMDENVRKQDLQKGKILNNKFRL